MSKIGEQYCVLCGKNIATTDEHVPPRNLFKKPRPYNLITVPACKNCNSGSSKDDEYFLHLVATTISPDEHPDLEYLLNNKVIKSLKRKQAMGLRKEFYNSLNQVHVTTEKGIYLGKQTVRYIEADRILNLVEKNARGLYYIEKNIIVPESANIEVMMIRPVESLDAMQERVEFFKSKKRGNDVFEYSSIIPHDCDISAGFYMKYFKHIAFFVKIEK